MKEEIKLMKGNEAIAHAAIRYGADGYFGYPITPQSEVMETLMEEQPWETTGMVVLQAESEVAAINMVYGGASCGKAVMTTSSSPGVSLMQEGVSGKRSSLGTTKARRAAGALPQFDCVGFHRECAQGRRSQGDGEVKRLHAGTPSGSYTGSEIRSGEADSGSGGQARYCYVQVRFFEEACLTGGHSNVLIKHRDQKIDSFR